MGNAKLFTYRVYKTPLSTLTLTWQKHRNMVSCGLFSVLKKNSRQLHSYLIVVEYKREAHNDYLATSNNGEKWEGTPYKIKCLPLLLT